MESNVTTIRQMMSGHSPSVEPDGVLSADADPKCDGKVAEDGDFSLGGIYPKGAKSSLHEGAEREDRAVRSAQAAAHADRMLALQEDIPQGHTGAQGIRLAIERSLAQSASSSFVGTAQSGRSGALNTVSAAVLCRDGRVAQFHAEQEFSEQTLHNDTSRGALENDVAYGLEERQIAAALRHTAMVHVRRADQNMYDSVGEELSALERHNVQMALQRSLGSETSEDRSPNS